MISYDEFIANASADDIRILNLFAMGQKIEFNDPAQADAMFAQVERLDAAGFVIRAHRGYERRAGALWQTFEAFIEPVAANYLARAASERVQLSREPLP